VTDCGQDAHDHMTNTHGDYWLGGIAGIKEALRFDCGESGQLPQSDQGEFGDQGTSGLCVSGGAAGFGGGSTSRPRQAGVKW